MRERERYIPSLVHFNKKSSIEIINLYSNTLTKYLFTYEPLCHEIACQLFTGPSSSSNMGYDTNLYILLTIRAIPKIPRDLD